MRENGDNNAVYLSSEHVLGSIKAREVKKSLDLDDVLTTELGQFGWFQLRNILLVTVPIAMLACMSEYVFSAAAVPHRCRISECGEEGKLYLYDPDWLQNVVPRIEYSSCKRYIAANIGTNGSLQYCPPYLFDQREIVSCDGFIYARNNSVVYEMNYWHGIPSIMFSTMGILSGILVLTQPETLGTKMPNTLAQSKALGKKTET